MNFQAVLSSYDSVEPGFPILVGHVMNKIREKSNKLRDIAEWATSHNENNGFQKISYPKVRTIVDIYKNRHRIMYHHKMVEICRMPADGTINHSTITLALSDATRPGPHKKIPSTCVVRNCKSNLKNEPNVRVFSFPRETELLEKWRHAIKRPSFTPTESSKVCELHFLPEEIKQEAASSSFDVNMDNDDDITVELERCYLQDGAVPSILPNPPSSTIEKTRISKRIQLRNSALESAFPRILLKPPSSSSSTKRKTQVSKKIKLKDSTHKRAFPRILLKPPSSSSSTKRKTPISTEIKLENVELQSVSNQIIADNFEHNEQKFFQSIDNLEEKLYVLDKNYWSVVRRQDTLIICRIVKTPYPQIGLSVVIEADFAVRVFCRDVEMNSIGEYTIPTHVTDVDTLEVLMENLKEVDIDEAQEKRQNVISVLKLISSFLLLVQDESMKYLNAIKFISEQINLMTLKELNYSAEMMIFSSLLYNCSPRAYRLLRDTNNVILPSYSTIRRLTLSTYVNPLVEQHDNNFLMYIKNKFKFLLQEDITVSLLVDEISLKPYFNRTDGLTNNGNEAATSAFAFTLKSVFSQYKDVVHIMSTKCVKAEDLFDVIKRLIIGLEEIGFRVLAVVTDTDAKNQKAMSLFCSPEKLSIVYPHPVMKSRPLFFLFDSVDVLKCIRNNWLAQKDRNKCMMFPKFCHNGNHELGNIQSAPFCTLQKLHALESQSLLKYGHKLTSEVISHTNLERQNVTLVLQIFNEYTIQELQILGKQKCLPNFAEVAGYINIFYIWWTIMNVKTPNTDCHRLWDKYCHPLKFKEESYAFLSVFCNWLEFWDRMAGNNGKLMKETFTALHHTTYAILELTKYCRKELKMTYLLPGKFQTDHLEERFGEFRQHSADQYNISVDELLECEKELGKLSGLKLHLPLNSQRIDLKNLQEMNWDEMREEEKFDVYKFNVDVTDDDVDACREFLPLVMYLAGYCCDAVFQKMKCKSCKTLISGTDDMQPETNRFFRGVIRQLPFYPNEMSKTIVLYNYVVTNKLLRNSSFLHCLNQRNLTMHVTLNVLANADLLFDFDSCDEGHSVEKLEKMLVWSSSNALLNNFCKKEDDNITSDTFSKKRKLETFE